MPQVSFAADIRPLFRAIDISHMKPHGVELDDYAYMSNPDNAKTVLAALSPHDAKPPIMPARRTLLDGGQARVVRPVAEGWIPAVSQYSTQYSVKKDGPPGRPARVANGISKKTEVTKSENDQLTSVVSAKISTRNCPVAWFAIVLSKAELTL
jgi:hypothetical protein